MKEVQKRFPATVSQEISTFLNNSKLDGELYAFLQSLSFPDGEGRTVVKKCDLPSQKVICEKIGIKTAKTYRVHKDALVEYGYLIEEDDKFILPNQEDIFLMIPLETLQFLLDTLAEQVIKIYVYLGQRYKYKESQNNGEKYVFTKDEIGKALGGSVRQNPRYYAIIGNALTCLELLGLIKVETISVGKIPRMRLQDFSFKVKQLENG